MFDHPTRIDRQARAALQIVSVRNRAMGMFMEIAERERPVWGAVSKCDNAAVETAVCVCADSDAAEGDLTHVHLPSVAERPRYRYVGDCIPRLPAEKRTAGSHTGAGCFAYKGPIDLLLSA
jgi:hypothetical protein